MPRLSRRLTVAVVTVAVLAAYGLAQAQPPEGVPPELPQSQELPQEALDGQAEAEEKHAAAEALAEAVQDWTACVAEHAAAQGDEKTRQPEPFDPTLDCGGKPDPADLGLTEPPEGTPQGPPEGTSEGPPEGTPEGPPEGTPDGPPEGTPEGPPEGTPDGPPEGTPDGPPEGTPDGPPDGPPET